MLGYEVTRWHPVLSGAGRDVDAVLDRFMGRGELNGGWTPPMDAYTRDGNYVFRVDCREWIRRIWTSRWKAGS